jgi:hypothetical protein
MSASIAVAPAGSGPAVRAALGATGARSLRARLEGTTASTNRLWAAHLHGPFMSPLHSLTSRGPEGSRSWALTARRAVLPVPVPLPTSPVAFHLVVRDALMFPFTSLPAVLPVVVPPTVWHVSIEGRRGRTIVGPPAVIAARTIPTPLPRTPPPAPAEEDVGLDVGYDVDVALGQDNHLRGRGKYDRWRQRHVDVHAHANLRPRRKGNEQRHEQQQRPYHRFCHSASFLGGHPITIPAD